MLLLVTYTIHWYVRGRTYVVTTAECSAAVIMAHGCGTSFTRFGLGRVVRSQLFFAAVDRSAWSRVTAACVRVMHAVIMALLLCACVNDAHRSCFRRLPHRMLSNFAHRGSVVAGGDGNTAGAGDSFVGAGQNNYASGQFASITAGYGNAASGYASAVVGGQSNIASGGFSAVLGGHSNTATGTFSTTMMGSVNYASGPFASVTAGYDNSASGDSSFVVGGQSNVASAGHSAVIGGYSNTATGSHATVLGGFYSIASGDFSLAMGPQVVAQSPYSAVISVVDDNTQCYDNGRSTVSVCAPGGFFVNSVDVEAAITTNTDNIAASVASIVALGGNVSELRGAVDDLSSSWELFDLTALATSKAVHDAQLVLLQSAVDTATAAVDALQSDSLQLWANASAQQDQVQWLEETAAQLLSADSSNRVATLEDTVAAQAVALTAADDNLHALNGTLEAQAAAIAELTAANTQQATKMFDLTEANRLLQTQLDVLNSTMAHVLSSLVAQGAAAAASFTAPPLDCSASIMLATNDLCANGTANPAVGGGTSATNANTAAAAAAITTAVTTTAAATTTTTATTTAATAATTTTTTMTAAATVISTTTATAATTTITVVVVDTDSVSLVGVFNSVGNGDVTVVVTTMRASDINNSSSTTSLATSTDFLSDFVDITITTADGEVGVRETADVDLGFQLTLSLTALTNDRSAGAGAGADAGAGGVAGDQEDLRRRLLCMYWDESHRDWIIRGVFLRGIKVESAASTSTSGGHTGTNSTDNTDGTSSANDSSGSNGNSSGLSSVIDVAAICVSTHLTVITVADGGAAAQVVEEKIQTFTARLTALAGVDLLAAQTQLNPAIPAAFGAISVAIAVVVVVAKVRGRGAAVDDARRVFVAQGALRRPNVVDGDEQEAIVRGFLPFGWCAWIIFLHVMSVHPLVSLAFRWSHERIVFTTSDKTLLLYASILNTFLLQAFFFNAGDEPTATGAGDAAEAAAAAAAAATTTTPNATAFSSTSAGGSSLSTTSTTGEFSSSSFSATAFNSFVGALFTTMLFFPVQFLLRYMIINVNSFETCTKRRTALHSSRPHQAGCAALVRVRVPRTSRRRRCCQRIRRRIRQRVRQRKERKEYSCTPREQHQRPSGGGGDGCFWKSADKDAGGLADVGDAPGAGARRPGGRRQPPPQPPQPPQPPHSPPSPRPRR